MKIYVATYSAHFSDIDDVRGRVFEKTVTLKHAFSSRRDALVWAYEKQRMIDAYAQADMLVSVGTLVFEYASKKVEEIELD